MRPARRPLYGIDAGGSGTSVAAWNGDRWSAPPANPTSIGRGASDRRLAGLFTRIRVHVDAAGERQGSTSARPALWLASAAVDPASAAGEVRRCAAAARAAGLAAELVVSNDVTPLVLGAPPDTGHIVVVCGTGSAFLATDGRSAPVRVGGCEYLGSDEGSAFDLGLRGLRAAVRASDGRGPRTALSDLLAAQAGAPVAELARDLAAAPFPKVPVAALAPVVLQAWQSGDEAAAAVVAAVLDELAAGLRAARDSAGLGPAWHMSAIGGVVTGCPEFFARLTAAAAELGAGAVTLISDPAAAVLAALTQIAAPESVSLSDPRIQRDSWCVDLASGAETDARRRA